MADFNQRVQGLLSNPAFNIGTGLLAQSGYSTAPVTFGQALGGAVQFANQRQAEQLQLQAARGQMQDASRRREALSELQGLLKPGQTPGPVVSPTPAPVTTPEGQARMTGLLAELNPEAYAQSLLQAQKPESPRLSTSVNDFMAMNPGVQIGTPEFANQYREFVAQQDPVGNLVEQAQLQLNMLQLQNAQAEREQKQETAKQERLSTARAVNTDLRHLKEMADLNAKLQGTFLSAGSPMPDARRGLAGAAQAIGQLFGNDTAKSQQVISDFDRFSKLITDNVISSIDRFAASGSLTNNKFDALLGSNASLGSSPQANNLIIADNIESLLDAADVEGINVADADSLRSLVKSLRTPQPQTPTRDVRTMTMEEMLSLDTKNISDQERAIIDQRLQEAGY